MSYPEFRSEPMQVVRLTHHCVACPRTFTMFGYSGQDLNEVDRILTQMIAGHLRRDHSSGEASK